MKSFFLFLLAIFHILLRKQVDCLLGCKENYGDYFELIKHLFCEYSRSEMPPKGSMNATAVQLGMHIIQFEVDEIGKTVDFHVWKRLVWEDSRLTWNPSDFHDTEVLHVKSYDIWMPDIVMHSTTIMGIDDAVSSSLSCWVSHKGAVSCAPSTVYSPICDSDHTWWPYDAMNCTINLASWSQASNEINLTFIEFNNTEGSLSMDMGSQNLEWKITHFSHSEHKVAFKYDANATTDFISFNVFLKRQSTMYGAIYMTMIPVLMTMTLTTLWLEPNSLERMILANFNFLVHLFSMLNLQWILPFNGSRPPELILFYENSLVLATFALMLTSILRYLQELNTDAPQWISSSTVSILKSRVGQIFLVSILDPKVSARIEMNADDNINLMSPDKKESTWRYTSILIGWLAFIAVLFTYVIMLFIYLPTSGATHSLLRKTNL